MSKNSRKMQLVDWLALPDEEKYIRNTNVSRYPLIRPYAIKDGKKFDYYFKSDGTMNRKLLEEHRMIYEEEKTKRSNHRNKGKKSKK